MSLIDNSSPLFLIESNRVKGRKVLAVMVMEAIRRELNAKMYQVLTDQERDVLQKEYPILVDAIRDKSIKLHSLKVLKLQATKLYRVAFDV